MLQIMTGRFFRGEERYRSEQKGILYSNFGWISPITMCVGTLEPVDYYTAASGFVFSFTNQMEKAGEPKAGELVRTGEREIVSQFGLLAGFALNAYFDTDRETVLFNCRARAFSGDEKYVPSQFVDDVFAEQRRGTVDDKAELIRFVNKAIAMPRAQYAALIDVLEALQRAYQAINGSLDLAYSMVVVCLESLAQRFDKYEPKWADHEERARKKIDKALAAVSPEVGDEVRGILVEGAHLKLRGRLIHFTRGHLSPNFFTTRAIGKKWPLRPSEFERALSNAYALRSGYVHQLRSIQEQLHQPFIADGEVFEWEHEPYLTLRGLTNIARDVIRNFVEQAPVLDKEDVDWRSDLPGIVRLMPAPQLWIWQHEHIEALPKAARIADVKARYHGLLQLVLEVATQKGQLVDLRKVVALYEGLIERCSKEERSAIMATYTLFNVLIAMSERAPQSEKLLPRFEDELAARTIESMSLEVVLDVELRGELSECLEAYETFSTTRFNKFTLQLPRLIEVKLLAAIANKALAASDANEHQRILDLAIGQAAGHGEIQAALVRAKTDNCSVELKSIFSLQA